MLNTRAPAGRVRVWELLGLLAIIALATWARLDDLETWRADAGANFVDGAPLLLNPDGYFFLSLARDLLENDYGAVDPLRGAPTGTSRPSPPPLLSLLTAAASRVAGLPAAWAAALLPALLGPLLALPVFAIGRRLSGPVAGLAAALVAVTSHYYVYRTTVGFHDTDALNVTLAVTLAFSGLGLAGATRERFAQWLTAGFATFTLWLWWWQGAHGVVTLVGAWTLVCAMALRAPDLRERAIAAAAATAAAGLALALTAPGALARMATHLGAIVHHVSKAPGGDFPNVAASIGEQVPATLSEAAQLTLGDPILLGFAVAGVAVLVFRNPGAALLLAPTLALAVGGVLYAQRFLIFAGPVTGLGIGFFTALGVAAAGRRRSVNALVLLGVMAVAAPGVHRGFSIDFIPPMGGDLASAMRWFERRTPENAVAWASWDHGYALRYFSRRATVNDGSVHAGEISVYTALPFAAPGFRLAANFLQFYSVHGQPGMQRIHGAAGGTAEGLALARRVFDAGPEAAREHLVEWAPATATDVAGWIAFLFPAEPPPLYLLMDQRMLRSARWWFAYGAWRASDPEPAAVRMQPFAGLTLDGARVIGPRLAVDLATGAATQEGGEVVALSRVAIATTRGVREQRYPQAGPEFHLHAVEGVGVLQDPALAETVFSRTFILGAADARYFRPIRQWGARAQIWQVRGDSP